MEYGMKENKPVEQLADSILTLYAFAQQPV